MVYTKFVIFSGSAENAVLMEEVDGLGRARRRIDEIASKTPGRYFVFHPPTQEIVATTDTSISDSSLNSAASA
jgi:hypothetical protein